LWFILQNYISYKSDWVQHVNRMPRSKTPKDVTLHATEALGGKGVYLLLILDLGTRWGE
jgi:hypothetical protein